VSWFVGNNRVNAPRCDPDRSGKKHRASRTLHSSRARSERRGSVRSSPAWWPRFSHSPEPSVRSEGHSRLLAGRLEGSAQWFPDSSATCCPRQPHEGPGSRRFDAPSRSMMDTGSVHLAPGQLGRHGSVQRRGAFAVLASRSVCGHRDLVEPDASVTGRACVVRFFTLRTWKTAIGTAGISIRIAVLGPPIRARSPTDYALPARGDACGGARRIVRTRCNGHQSEYDRDLHSSFTTARTRRYHCVAVYRSDRLERLPIASGPMRSPITAP
jgi:hypothetical protein